MTAPAAQPSQPRRRRCPGSPFPLGATVGDGRDELRRGGRRRRQRAAVPVRRRRRREPRSRCSDYDAGVWHGFVPGVGAGQAYGYRVAGRYDPGSGLRFNPAKLLLDPYARAIAGDGALRAGGARVRGRRPGRAEHARLGRRTCRAAWSWTRRSSWRDDARPRRSLRGHGHLRGARQGLHHAPPGVPPSCAAPTPGSGTRPPSAT